MSQQFLKIFSVNQIRLADAYTIKNEPISSINLMERAAKACVYWLQNEMDLSGGIMIFCGTGNNGGDGLAIARLLFEQDKNMNIRVYIFQAENKPSEDFTQNLNRLFLETSIQVVYLQENTIIDSFSETIVVDAILGSGLSRLVEGELGTWIEKINKMPAKAIVSIDIPSGLFCDKPTYPQKNIIKATHTLSFQFPKLAFLMSENALFVGDFSVLPIGLSEDYILNTSTYNYLITEEAVNQILKPRLKFAHKGNFGHALIIAGSYGKTGAAVLSSKACLRSGVGLLTTHLPKKSVDILQIALPEAMVEIDENDFCFSKINVNCQQYHAIGIGPALGKEPITLQAFNQLLDLWQKPMVIDADALNLLSENPKLLGKVPANSILTPHVREFERLLGKFGLTSFELHEAQKEFSKKYNVIVVLKGAHTCISLPSGECYFNNNGNAGMATAGSGDVLTGIITAYLAQQYEPWQAAVMGVFMHGRAGDKAKGVKGEQALIASDIIENL